MSVHSYLYGKSTDYIPVPFGWPVLLDSTFLDTPGLVADADADADDAFWLLPTACVDFATVVASCLGFATAAAFCDVGSGAEAEGFWRDQDLASYALGSSEVKSVLYVHNVVCTASRQC